MLKVATQAQYLGKFQKVMDIKGVAETQSPLQLTAYENAGRLVADCPNCHGGIAIEPSWSEAGCLDCGFWYTNIVLPS